MNANVNIRWSGSLLALALVILSGCDASITKYEPSNQYEKEIILVLIQYQDARNHFDSTRLLSFLHEKGEFSFACGLMVSKTKLREMLPGLWDEIQSGNHTVIPMVHECINGDYLKSGELNNPKIEINNDTAEVTVMFTSGVCRMLQYFSMLRENGRWLITRTEWGYN